MYQTLHLQIVLLETSDIVCTSTSDWYDENADVNGWT